MSVLSTSRRVRAHCRQLQRRLRTERGWSLDALVGRANVSKSVLVSIEQGKSNPNLSTLFRLSDAFGLPVTKLVEDDDEPQMRVLGPERAVRLWTGASGGSGVLLAGSDPPHGVELWHWELFPGERRCGEAHAHGTREVIHVEAGDLTLTAASVTRVIPEGSSAVFPGDRDHVYANERNAPVTFTLVVTVVTIEDYGEL